jgi:hypothetical protein
MEEGHDDIQMSNDNLKRPFSDIKRTTSKSPPIKERRRWMRILIISIK